MSLDPFHQQSQDNVNAQSGALNPGQTMFGGRFVLEKHLGQGGMGQVWLAQDAALDEARALKFVLPALLSDASARKRLRNEARLGTHLAHPRIVRVFDFAEETGGSPLAAVVMEFVEGRTLNELLAEKDCGFFEPKEIEHWLQEVIEGLRYAHEEKQRFHLDLKPGNIMVETSTGRAKLLDFGISRSAKDTITRMTGQVSSGTLPYMSPQQLDGEAPCAADDVYGLGATVYELLTGTPPFFRGKLEDQIRGKVPDDVAERRRQNAREGLNSGMGEAVPADWISRLQRLLSKDPARRLDLRAAWHEEKVEAKATPTAPTHAAAPATAVQVPAPAVTTRAARTAKPPATPSQPVAAAPAGKAASTAEFPAAQNWRGVHVLLGVAAALALGASVCIWFQLHMSWAHTFADHSAGTLNHLFVAPSFYVRFAIFASWGCLLAATMLGRRMGQRPSPGLVALLVAGGMVLAMVFIAGAEMRSWFDHHKTRDALDIFRVVNAASSFAAITFLCTAVLLITALTMFLGLRRPQPWTRLKSCLVAVLVVLAAGGIGLSWTSAVAAGDLAKTMNNRSDRDQFIRDFGNHSAGITLGLEALLFVLALAATVLAVQRGRQEKKRLFDILLPTLALPAISLVIDHAADAWNRMRDYEAEYEPSQWQQVWFSNNVQMHMENLETYWMIGIGLALLAMSRMAWSWNDLRRSPGG